MVSPKNVLFQTASTDSGYHTAAVANIKKWYPLRVTYSREMVFKAWLDARNIENFVPLRYAEVTCGGRKHRKLVPIIHNLIFVYSTRKFLDAQKKELEARLPVRYIMDPELHCPIVIPEKQMRDFIAVAGTLDEQLVWLDAAATKLKKGDKVRIIGGLFKGVEGVLMRIKGDRRVVVAIQGFMAVATAFIHPSLLEKEESALEKQL